MKLFVDDERYPPDSDDVWHIARSYAEAIDMLSRNKYDVLSLDHDIASFDENGKEKTGYDIALWLAENKWNDPNYYIPSKILVHSANPVGAVRIEGIINRYLGHKK